MKKLARPLRIIIAIFLRLPAPLFILFLLLTNLEVWMVIIGVSFFLLLLILMLRERLSHSYQFLYLLGAGVVLTAGLLALFVSSKYLGAAFLLVIMGSFLVNIAAMVKTKPKQPQKKPVRR